MTIKCDAGKTIKITSALYGRKSRFVCLHFKMWNVKCESKSSMVKVREACDGRDTCVLAASNSVFGDPCRGTYKYLTVQYTCINTEVKIRTEVQCEGKTMTIKCDAGKTIKITSALYGRKSRFVCLHFKMWNVKCESKSSMVKVREACDGRDTCVLAASNSVFGDPCRGTYKYLTVQYTCINTE
ncbi:L-rhamnose-binding lectin CSL3-like [Ylistrum balloti]|uniref:L-rhamnose-binding lectin CSL3-like n=1 Tax=Ylistrum balloti TaxID=509963 RepID=UPI002905B9E4|nr:L-rhamnose-binding lectin CSL3-like [Ylistrum balloti]